MKRDLERMQGVRAVDIMQEGVVSVSPELSLADFEEFLTGEEISGAPVVDGRGELVGIASKTDIIRHLSSDLSYDFRGLLSSDAMVQDIMTREVVTVSPYDDVSVVASRMVEEHVHRVLVVESSRVLGIITSLDLLRLLT